MIRRALEGKETNPQTAFLIMLYMASKGLGISPLEVYKMPISLVKDMLSVHGAVEEMKYNELEKAQKQAEAKYGGY